MPTPTVFPVSRRFIGVAKELVAGTPVAPAITMPQTTFKPVDKPNWLKDAAWRNSMAGTYGIQQGPIQATLDLGGPFFGDTIGVALVNMFGDVASSGVPAGGGGSTTLTSPATAGASSITVASISNFTAGDLVQIGTGTTSEIRKVLTASASTITFDPTLANGTLYYAHASAQTAVEVNGPFTHKFTLLNAGTGAGGSLAAQPPTHTFTDYTGVTPTVEARCYAGSVLSELTFTGQSTDLLVWSAKGDSWVSTPVAAKPVAAVSNVATQPSWRSKMGIGGVAGGGTQVNNGQQWSVTITRDTSVEFTNQGTQNPFSIVRGDLTATGGINFMPAIDETPLSNMLNNAQPQLQVVADNGLTGLNQVTLTLDAQICAFTDAPINDGGTAFGYDNQFEAVANTTNIGQSGGYGPLAVTLMNNFPTY